MPSDNECQCATRSEHAIVAIFNACSDVEDAVKSLEKSAYDMKRLSFVGRDYHAEAQVIGYYNTGERSGYWGKMGVFWNFLSGSAFLVAPGIGPIVAGGPVVGWILDVLEGSVAIGGISSIGAALCGVGIPKDSIFKYEAALKSNQFLVIASGSASEIGKVRDVLQSARTVGMDVHRPAAR